MLLSDNLYLPASVSPVGPLTPSRVPGRDIMGGTLVGLVLLLTLSLLLLLTPGGPLVHAVTPLVINTWSFTNATAKGNTITTIITPNYGYKLNLKCMA